MISLVFDLLLYHSDAECVYTLSFVSKEYRSCYTRMNKSLLSSPTKQITLTNLMRNYYLYTRVELKKLLSGYTLLYSDLNLSLRFLLKNVILVSVLDDVEYYFQKDVESSNNVAWVDTSRYSLKGVYFSKLLSKNSSSKVLGEIRLKYLHGSDYIRVLLLQCKQYSFVFDRYPKLGKVNINWSDVVEKYELDLLTIHQRNYSKEFLGDIYQTMLPHKYNTVVANCMFEMKINWLCTCM